MSGFSSLNGVSSVAVPLAATLFFCLHFAKAGIMARRSAHGCLL
ncbi:hypothetical protein LHK_02853 [Laribacter hongkongensis HLHK9]|uniref:Uncharacterized protein n=1 Tax=Laribacter hongkongensis (strain HLHK9) TaxID=557598 RepID=C1D4P2_LARHH|nr:hypothetical protein LHK_02853 [Laribacter hongkongensis HLHK9]